MPLGLKQDLFVRVQIKVYFIKTFSKIDGEERYLKGDNLIVVLAELTNLSCSVLLQRKVNALHAHSHF